MVRSDSSQVDILALLSIITFDILSLLCLIPFTDYFVAFVLLLSSKYLTYSSVQAVASKRPPIRLQQSELVAESSGPRVEQEMTLESKYG